MLASFFNMSLGISVSIISNLPTSILRSTDALSASTVGTLSGGRAAGDGAEGLPLTATAAPVACSGVVVVFEGDIAKGSSLGGFMSLRLLLSVVTETMAALGIDDGA